MAFSIRKYAYGGFMRFFILFFMILSSVSVFSQDEEEVQESKKCSIVCLDNNPAYYSILFPKKLTEVPITSNYKSYNCNGTEYFFSLKVSRATGEVNITGSDYVTIYKMYFSTASSKEESIDALLSDQTILCGPSKSADKKAYALIKERKKSQTIAAEQQPKQDTNN
jgi:hypothetical protein